MSKRIQQQDRNQTTMGSLSVEMNLNIRQCKDGARGSTFLKDAKIAGGIESYLLQDSTYEHWVLRRAGKVEYQSEIMNITKMNRDAQKA